MPNIKQKEDFVDKIRDQLDKVDKNLQKAYDRLPTDREVGDFIKGVRKKVTGASKEVISGFGKMGEAAVNGEWKQLGKEVEKLKKMSMLP